MANVKIRTTDFGINLLVRALANESAIEFTCMKFGNGDEPEDYSSLTDLVNPLLKKELTGYTREEGSNYVELKTSFSNEDVDSDFRMTEIGVFAKSTDIEEGLFGYIHQEGEPVLSGDSNKLLENVFTVQVIVGEDAEVTASTASTTYVTTDIFKKHIEDKNNPHEVTAEQVGLGKTENKAIQDGQVTLDTIDADENLEDGDSVRTIAAKVFRAIKRLYDHIADTNNPHKLTASAIGAAEASHNHSAADINSGILGVPRGGTGKGSWTANQLVYASASDTLSQLTNPSGTAFLMQGATGAPAFVAKEDVAFYWAGTTAPSSTNLLWIDTTDTTGGLKYYNGSSWVHVPVAYTS